MRIPSLDGLRAISIMVVILQHMDSALQFGDHNYLWRFELGDLGVRIFFVISGFLITSLLLQEKLKYGRIDLGKFYVRRFLRIFPAYYLFLGFLAFCSLVGLLDLSVHDFFGPSLYLSNYISTARVMAHTWSLAVEEQFYLIWPILLVIGGARFGFVAAILMLCMAPLIRIYLTMHAQIPPIFWRQFEVAGDAIATGCIFAMIRPRLLTMRYYGQFISSSTVFVILLIALLFLATSFRWPLFWGGAGITMANVLVMLVIDACIRNTGSLYFRILNSRLLVFVGSISYSLYIWQQFFAYSRLTTAYYVSFPLLFIVAICSYHFIELPSLRLKRAFSRS